MPTIALAEPGTDLEVVHLAKDAASQVFTVDKLAPLVQWRGCISYGCCQAIQRPEDLHRPIVDKVCL